MTMHEVSRRSDGERTHAAILEIATAIASVEGIEGLTIGRLARELGVSKSGVYAHFGSKERLQLETIEAAQVILEREVLAAVRAAPEGMAQIEALCDAFLSYVQRLVFPGGCFFASLLAELDARSGHLHDLAREAAWEWLGMIETMARRARQNGEIAADVDTELLAFQLDACLEAGNYYYVLFRDPAVIERARRSVDAILRHARPSA